MIEVFYEESAKTIDTKSASRKFYIFKILSIISYVLVAVWLCIIFIGFDFRVFNSSALAIVISLLIHILPLVFFIASGIFLGRFKNRFYVDYDYTFVSGSIRISKVIKNCKRKSLLVFEAKDIETLGKVGSETYEKYENTPGIKPLVLTSNDTPAEGKAFYYLIAGIDGEKKLLILECTELFMVNILKFTSRSVLEKDYK